MYLSTFRFLMAAMIASTIACASGWADVFELTDGGQVVGKRIEQNSNDQFVIQTNEGAQVILARSHIQRVVQQNEAAAEYGKRSRAAADTAEAHRELAAWCREHKLLDEVEHHLLRVIELDPDDEEARRSLGYQRVGDRWLDRDGLMTARGLRFYDGKYRTTQDIAVREREKQSGDVEVDWSSNLRLWRGWLDSRREAQAQEAMTKITAINDPQAAPGIVKVLDSEENEEVIRILLAVLGRLDHPSAVRTLVGFSLEDEDAEIRRECLDYLVNGPRPVTILPYVQALKSKDNVIVNRAGTALGVIGDPTAVSPLIDTLVTTHKYEIPSDQIGQTSASFSPNGGGGGFSTGGNGPKIISRDEKNHEVQRTLIQLTGAKDLGFDERAWRAWYVDQQMRERVNSRRDD